MLFEVFNHLPVKQPVFGRLMLQMMGEYLVLR